MQHLSLHLSFPIYYTGNHLAQPYLTINYKSAHCHYLLPNNDFFVKSQLSHSFHYQDRIV